MRTMTEVKMKFQPFEFFIQWNFKMVRIYLAVIQSFGLRIYRQNTTQICMQRNLNLVSNEKYDMHNNKYFLNCMEQYNINFYSSHYYYNKIFLKTHCC